MASEYFLLFKTAQAEFRAWDALSPDAKRHVFPIVELTRGRKIPNSEKDRLGEGIDIDKDDWSSTEGIYNFWGNVTNVRDAFERSEHIVIDLTREEELTCFEIDALARSENGYEKWVEFLKGQKDNFRDLIPTLLINPSDGESEEDYKTNIGGQFDDLMREFSGVSYRGSVLLDPDFLYDLIILKDKINGHLDNGKRFWVELDHEFIRPRTGLLHAATTLGLIDRIHEIVPRAEIVILSTSFPRNIEELGDPEDDSFPLEEVFLYEEIAKNIKEDVAISYGDYGSINPLRNDLVFTRGWRPRIDFPTSKKRIFYYREKRNKDKHEKYSTYESHYISVAEKVVKNSLFEDIPESWGVKQIKYAASGAPPGKAPSFWISVRMEIHILQQIKRLGLG